MATKIGGRPAEPRHVLRDERPVGLLACDRSVVGHLGAGARYRGPSGAGPTRAKAEAEWSGTIEPVCASTAICLTASPRSQQELRLKPTTSGTQNQREQLARIQIVVLIVPLETVAVKSARKAG